MININNHHYLILCYPLDIMFIKELIKSHNLVLADNHFMT